MGNSRSKVEQPFMHTWTIDHFLVWLYDAKAEKFVYSPPFSTGDHQWRLRVDRNEGEDYISLFLKPFQSPKSKVIAEFILGSYEDESDWAWGWNKPRVKHHFNFKATDDNCCGWTEFILKDDLLKSETSDMSWANDTLTVFCNITILSDPSPPTGLGIWPILAPKPRVNFPWGHPRIPNFRCLLQSQKVSDITLIVGTKEIPAHKIILVIASPVFEAMFDHDMKEKIEKRVEIKDIDLTVFEEFLHFIYVGTVKNLEKNAEDLLVVAERYGFERLKALCEAILTSHLSVENIVDMHRLANLHNANQLKVYTTKFFKKHFAEIENSDEFRSFVKNNPNPFIDVLEE